MMLMMQLVRPPRCTSSMGAKLQSARGLPGASLAMLPNCGSGCTSVSSSFAAICPAPAFLASSSSRALLAYPPTSGRSPQSPGMQRRCLLQVKYRKKSKMGDGAPSSTSGTSSTHSRSQQQQRERDDSTSFSSFAAGQRREETGQRGSRPNARSTCSSGSSSRGCSFSAATTTSRSSSASPYLIRRTPSGNLPVYTSPMGLGTAAGNEDDATGNSKRGAASPCSTASSRPRGACTPGYKMRIQRIWGDVESLIRDLQQNCLVSSAAPPGPGVTATARATIPRRNIKVCRRRRIVEFLHIEKAWDEKVKQYLVAMGF